MPKPKQEDNSTSGAWFKKDPREKGNGRSKAFFHRPLTVKLGELIDRAYSASVREQLKCGS